jgi:predicted nuclease with TOPRIM domain
MMDQANEVEARESQVSEKLNQLGYEIECLEKNLVDLEERLETILIPGAIKEERVEKEPSVLVPLAHRLNGFSIYLAKLNSGLADLKRRIEL